LILDAVPYSVVNILLVWEICDPATRQDRVGMVFTRTYEVGGLG
jgi:hypothetical protein